MANAPMRTVLQHLRVLATAPASGQQTDGTLLRAFAEQHDQIAFTALVKRHGPMVLATCRRVLHNLHDAEDALQATFILLARNAVTVRKQESLASWLHGVAYRMARNAQRAASRRRKHEGEVKPMRACAPEQEMAWREVQALLDEEIQRLPEIYRTAFILCCLENKASPEAAQALGIKEGTVRTRLAKARTLLQRALARRGVTLSAVLATVALSSGPAAAVLSSPLVSTTVRAAALLTAGNTSSTGLVSANVAALLKGAQTTVFLTRLKTLTMVLILAATAGGIGVGASQTETDPPPPAPARGPIGTKDKPPAADRLEIPEKAAQDKVIVDVTGQVLDPNGKPVSGAKLYVGYSTPHGWGLPRPGPGKGAPLREVQAKDAARPVAARATSGEDGKFRFTFARSDLDEAILDEDWGRPAVIAVAADSGPDWAEIAGKTANVTLRLVRDDLPINGRILDEDGRPVGGAQVRVVCLAGEKDIAKKWAGPVPGQPARVTTGADGRFRLTGLGRDRRVILALAGATIQHRQISALTTATGAVDKGHEGHGLPATFDFLASASKPIRGVVRDQATGKPVAGVRMSSQETQAVTYTDKEGRYELLGFAKAPHYAVTAQPQYGQLYFAAGKGAADTPGLEALAVDFDLVGGIEVRGRVIDLATGKPPKRAVVEYYPLYPNAHIRKIPDYAEAASSAVIEPDGSYRLAVLPGPGVIGAIAAPREAYGYGLVTPKELADLFKDNKDHGNAKSLHVARGPGYGGILQERYSALTLIAPEERTASLTRDIGLAPAHTLRGTVHGPDGKPLAGATVMLGLQSSTFGYPEVLKGADFVVRRLTPRRTRELVFQHQEKGLGKFVVVPGDRAEPLIVRLEPYGSVTGRLLGKDKKPMPGNKLHIGRSGFVTSELPDKTDRDGRFSVEGLIPGQGYRLMSFRDELGWGIDFTAEAGQKIDVGDLQPVDR